LATCASASLSRYSRRDCVHELHLDADELGRRGDDVESLERRRHEHALHVAEIEQHVRGAHRRDVLRDAEPDDALPCGSMSTTSVRWPSAARADARLIAVVVLPTPPFWFETVRM
jgi:hypothetical protein